MFMGGGDEGEVTASVRVLHGRAANSGVDADCKCGARSWGRNRNPTARDRKRRWNYEIAWRGRPRRGMGRGLPGTGPIVGIRRRPGWFKGWDASGPRAHCGAGVWMGTGGIGRAGVRQLHPTTTAQSTGTPSCTHLGWKRVNVGGAGQNCVGFGFAQVDCTEGRTTRPGRAR